MSAVGGPLSATEVAAAVGGELRLPDGVDGNVKGLTRLRDPREILAGGAEARDVVVLPGPLTAETEGPARRLGLLVLDAAHAPDGAPPSALLLVTDVRLALARLSSLFQRAPLPDVGVHPTAVVASDAKLGADVAIAAGAVIGSAAELADGCVVGPNAVVGAGARLGRQARLHANVTLYPGVRIGERVEVHSGCVIGSDGFGYAAGPRGAEKIHHGGSVVVHADVEIGANTTVDRGTLGDTVIGARTKIDNLCTVAHNVVIGSDCLIAGKTGIAGSTTIGDRVIIGGGAGITDHVTIGDDARIAGLAGVSKDVPSGETWTGNPARPHRHYVRDLYLRSRLERIWQHVLGAERDAEES